MIVARGQMTSDLLPSADMLPASRQGDPVAPGAASARLRPGFIVEYPSGSGREADTQELLATAVARLEAAIRGPQPAVPAALATGLGELAEAVARIETVLSATEASAPHIHFAVEHIQDIAMALRQRDVEASLCDTLEAAIRDVGDAIVRGDAGAARALSAAAMLRNLAARVNELSAIAVSVAAEAVRAAPVTQGFEEDSRQTETEKSLPMADSPNPFEAHIRGEGLPSQAAPPLTLPDKEAMFEERESSYSVSVPSPLSIPSPIEADDRVSSHSADREGQVAPTTDAAANQPGPNEEPVALILPEPLADVHVAMPVNSRASISDPLAPLYALSEEELIALFS
jgi:hypothetical protein